MPGRNDLDPVAVVQANLRAPRHRDEVPVDSRRHGWLRMPEMLHEVEQRGDLGNQVRPVHDEAHELLIGVPVSAAGRKRPEERGGPLAVELEKV